MNFKEWFEVKHPKPVCVGTGLVALDVIINGNLNSPPRFSAGGSCGNVLTILSYLGWESYPIAIMREDVAASELLSDMKSWNVNTCLIFQDSSGNTPIIVEKLGTSLNGIPWHRFEWTCPNCGSWLPKYKPVPVKFVDQISKKMPKAQIFYFDRVARSSVELAKVNKNHGALIVFEPSSIKNGKIFFECLQVADIVKYSHERLGHSQELIQKLMEKASVLLEIETLGEDGLRYRFNSNGKQNKKWKKMHAFTVKNLKDTAGAGDWCSAGIIQLLGSSGRKGFEKIEEKDIDTALGLGQALAALNCYYEGARGSVYNISIQKFEELVHDIWNGISTLESTEEKENDLTSQFFELICPRCVQKDANK